MPDEVEVTTGEEEEKVLFASRAKLFRFIEKQWKERGLGEIKILFREDTSQARIVMRRDQVKTRLNMKYLHKTHALPALDRGSNTYETAMKSFS